MGREHKRKKHRRCAIIDANMSNVSALYHIVFCTKYRKMTISDDFSDDVYRFIWSIVKSHKSFLYRIGGICNHIHMLVDLNPTVALSSLVRDIKAKSSGWMKSDNRFPLFEGWAREYYASTLSYKDKSTVIQYIINQRIHHNVTDFNTEIELLCANANLVLHEDDFKL